MRNSHISMQNTKLSQRSAAAHFVCLC